MTSKIMQSYPLVVGIRGCQASREYVNTARTLMNVARDFSAPTSPQCDYSSISASKNGLRTCRLYATTSDRNGNGDGPVQEDNMASFGFRQVPKVLKEGLVGEVFKRVAPSYDKMNDAMSMGIHRLWKREFIKDLNPDSSTRLLDVAGGTGDIAFRFLDHIKSNQYHPNSNASSPEDGLQRANVTVCDINASMVEQGRIRASERGISTDQCDWVVGSAEDLPFESNSFDAYTISFGIRNVTNINKALEEANRVLVRGGRFMCLEFSHVPNSLLRRVYDEYSFQVIPVLGEVIASDYDSYQYLVESIRRFPKQDRFVQMIESAGFSCVTYRNLSGGIAAIHSGYKL